VRIPAELAPKSPEDALERGAGERGRRAPGRAGAGGEAVALPALGLEREAAAELGQDLRVQKPEVKGVEEGGGARA